jgi:hypothetical protein
LALLLAAPYDPDILKGGLDRWLERYSEKPFAISHRPPKFTLQVEHMVRYEETRPSSIHAFPMDNDRCARIRTSGEKELK